MVISSSVAPAAPTLGFCVGVFPPLRTRAGDIVTVRFETGNGTVFSPSAPVGTQVTVQVPPGPYKILVKGHPQVSGIITAGEIRNAAVGTGCPG